MSQPKTGWWNPRPFNQGSKFHYATETGRSLCGQWAYLGIGELEEGLDESPDNCAGCRRKKLAMNKQKSTGGK